MARSLASVRGRKLILAALLIALVSLVVVAPVFVLAMAPAIVLFALFAHRVMPGEERLVRLLDRHAPVRRRRIALVQAPYGVIVVRRVGRSFAAALAMRPPPAPLFVSS